MLVGVRVHVNPAGVTLEDSVTVPVKPVRLVTVIVDVAAALASAVTLVGLAATLKLAPVDRVTVAVWVRPELEPVTVIVYVPAAEGVHVNVDVPEVPRTTLVGARAQLMPVAGEVATVRLTVPVNPFRLVTVTV